MNPDLLLLLNAAAALYLTGVIWVIQGVHYPLLAAVPAGDAPAYVRQHVKRMGAIVGPAMVLEVLVLLALALTPHPRLLPGWLLQNVLLIGIIWFKTFACAVPCHRRLAQTFDLQTHRRLLTTNWIRTAAWTLRAGLAVTALWITRG